MTNILGWLGTRQQRTVLVRIREHVAAVQQVVRLLAEAIEAFRAGDRQRALSLYQQVSNTEHQADIIRRELLESLSEGLMLPPDRQDLVQLIERVDDVADYANSAARLLILFKDGLPQEVSQDISRFAATLVDAAEKLAVAMGELYKGDAKRTLDACTAVETVEEDCDQQKAALLEKIFSMKELGAPMLLLLHDLIESMENTADRAEDSADVIRIVAVKHRG